MLFRRFITQPSFSSLLQQTKKTFRIEDIPKPAQKLPEYRLYVKSSKNNTILSFASNGNVLFQTSSGQCVKKHQRKTSDAAAQATLLLLQKVSQLD
jgi:ribosomal protein S11